MCCPCGVPQPKRRRRARSRPLPPRSIVRRRCAGRGSSTLRPARVNPERERTRHGRQDTPVRSGLAGRGTKWSAKSPCGVLRRCGVGMVSCPADNRRDCDTTTSGAVGGFIRTGRRISECRIPRAPSQPARRGRSKEPPHGGRPPGLGGHSGLGFHRRRRCGQASRDVSVAMVDGWASGNCGSMWTVVSAWVLARMASSIWVAIWCACCTVMSAGTRAWTVISV